MLDLRPTALDHPDAERLNRDLQRYYADIYGDEDVSPMDPLQFAGPQGVFVVGYVGGAAVACGGWRAVSEDADPHLRHGDAEIKRMYVAEGHRGKGYARAVLAELERTAAAAGQLRLVLETGVQQPDAMALYESAGYEPMPKFGYYRDSPDSRCYAKLLTVHPGKAEPGRATGSEVPACQTS